MKSIQVSITLGLLGLLFLMPLSGNGADLTVSNVITGNGNMTLNGTMSATSFSGSASGLTNLPPGAIAFYGNVAVVAPSGGDYTNPATAMGAFASWCGTPSDTNPCLLKIMPGVYDIGTSTVVMQPYIDIEGSGQNVTVITGTVSNPGWPLTNGVVNGASNAEIRFLTVKRTGSGEHGAAIVNSSASPAITHVTAAASGGSGNYGVYNNSSSPTMTNIAATVSGTVDNYGVFNNSSSPAMTNVTATASGGASGYNHGVYNFNSSSPTMTNVTATVSGGSNSYGVYNDSSSPIMTIVTAAASGATYNRGVYNINSSSPTMTNVTVKASGGTESHAVYNNSSSPTMTNVTATGSGGTTSYGLYVSNSSTVLIDRSTFEGSNNSISNSGTVNIGASKLASAKTGTGTYHCVLVYKYIGGILSEANGTCD